jgi:hypothetical protein
MVENLFSESASRIVQGRLKQAYAYIDSIGPAIRELPEAEIQQACEYVDNQFGIYRSHSAYGSD